MRKVKEKRHHQPLDLSIADQPDCNYHELLIALNAHKEVTVYNMPLLEQKPVEVIYTRKMK